jgi:hypothetical protein
MTRAAGLRPAAKPRPFDAKTKPALPSIPPSDGETFFCAQSEMFCGGYKRRDSRPAIHPDSTHKITESLSSSESLVSCLVQALPEARALELTNAISGDLANFCYVTIHIFFQNFALTACSFKYVDCGAGGREGRRWKVFAVTGLSWENGRHLRTRFVCYIHVL